MPCTTTAGMNAAAVVRLFLGCGFGVGTKLFVVHGSRIDSKMVPGATGEGLRRWSEEGTVGYDDGAEKIQLKKSLHFSLLLFLSCPLPWTNPAGHPPLYLRLACEDDCMCKCPPLPHQSRTHSSMRLCIVIERE